MLTQEQIEMRMQGVGGSDMPVIAGLPEARATARELYHVKRGEIDGDEIYRRIHGAGSETLAWLGNQIEPVLAAWYERETGRKTYNAHKTLVHPELPWMRGNVDRLVRGGQRGNKRESRAGDRRGLEFKMRVHGDGWGHTHTDQVPDDVIVQVQDYMEITGRDLWDVVVIIGGADIRMYTVPRDQSLINKLIDRGGDFWDHVQRGTPPDFDFEHRTTNALLDVLHPGTDGRVIELPDSAEHWHQVLQDSLKLRREYDTTADIAKAHLKRLMGDAAVGLFADGGIYNRKEVTRAAHEVAASHFTTITYKKPPRVRS